MSKNTVNKMIAEAIGTFAIVFAGCGCVMVAERFPGSMAAGAVDVVFGVVVAAMVYALGHVSGAHFNPAVTLAFTVGKRFDKKLLPYYWIAQVTGAFAATTLLYLILPPGKSFGATIPAVSPGAALCWEIAITFMLMFVVMGAATDSRAVGGMAGVAIGGAVMIFAFLAGPITGASMNPARSLAPNVFEGRLDVMWIYVVGPMIGAVLATFVYDWIKEVALEEAVENKMAQKIIKEKTEDLSKRILSGRPVT